MKQEEYNDRKNNSSDKDEDDYEKEENQDEYLLDRTMKKRADIAVSSLINSLEVQKIATEKKLEKLDGIIKKLADLETKLNTQTAINLVKYLQEQLELKKEMFEQVDDIEAIFNMISE
ncbi:MAG: hypothetical protein ACPHY8_05910 [Patescibacteria group bacterium]